MLPLSPSSDSETWSKPKGGNGVTLPTVLVSTDPKVSLRHHSFCPAAFWPVLRMPVWLSSSGAHQTWCPSRPLRAISRSGQALGSRRSLILMFHLLWKRLHRPTGSRAVLSEGFLEICPLSTLPQEMLLGRSSWVLMQLQALLAHLFPLNSLSDPLFKPPQWLWHSGQPGTCLQKA